MARMAGERAIYLHLADNLRKRRRDLDVSQAELGLAAGGLPQCYISALECGQFPRVPQHVDDLARALGVTRAMLLARSAATRGRRDVYTDGSADASAMVASHG